MRADKLHSIESNRDPAIDVLRIVPSDRRLTLELAARRNRGRASWVFALAFVFTSVALLFRRFGQIARARTPASLADVQTAIDAGNHAYLAALEAGDARGYASVFTQDAVSMPARGRLVRGRATIEASIADAFKSMRFTNGSLTSSQTHLDGDTAYEIGDYAFDVATDGASQHLTGRYLVVWRREGAAWKIAVDSSQPNAPEPVS
jgi:uncharacterized protein (TIGR02246 family)